jgi:hypothetical protein
MQRAFSGSASALVLAALRSGISRKEREEIEKLLKDGEDPAPEQAADKKADKGAGR